MCVCEEKEEEDEKPPWPYKKSRMKFSKLRAFISFLTLIISPPHKKIDTQCDYFNTLWDLFFLLLFFLFSKIPSSITIVCLFNYPQPFPNKYLMTHMPGVECTTKKSHTKMNDANINWKLFTPRFFSVWISVDFVRFKKEMWKM